MNYSSKCWFKYSSITSNVVNEWQCKHQITETSQKFLRNSIFLLIHIPVGYININQVLLYGQSKNSESYNLVLSSRGAAILEKAKLKEIFILTVYVCSDPECEHGHCSTHMEVRGQLSQVSLLLPYRNQTQLISVRGKYIFSFFSFSTC